MDELSIRTGDDVVRVRQQVRVVAAKSGLSLVDQTKVVTAGTASGSALPTKARGSRTSIWPLPTAGARATDSGSACPARGGWSTSSS
jgi:hypothetical protein